MTAAGIMALAIGIFPASLKASCTDVKEEKPAVHRLKGRIIDQDGASVEYVAVGILRLTGNEIDVAVVYPAETKEKTLVSKGARFPAAFGVFNPDDTGTEVGSNVKVKKRFIIKKFSFKVAACSIEGTKVSLNVYRITDDSFENILHRPIYIDIDESQDMKLYEVSAEELLLLEPGEYFVSIAFVGCSEKDKKEWEEQKTWTGKKYAEASVSNQLMFPLYFKSSHVRNGAMGKISRCGLNIGMSVFGIEYYE